MNILQKHAVLFFRRHHEFWVPFYALYVYVQQVVQPGYAGTMCQIVRGAS